MVRILPQEYVSYTDNNQFTCQTGANLEQFLFRDKKVTLHTCSFRPNPLFIYYHLLHVFILNNNTYTKEKSVKNREHYQYFHHHTQTLAVVDLLVEAMEYRKMTSEKQQGVAHAEDARLLPR